LKIFSRKELKENLKNILFLFSMSLCFLRSFVAESVTSGKAGGLGEREPLKAVCLLS